MLSCDVRKDFPILDQKINGHPLVYLDTAATSLKPKVTVEALQDFYTLKNANVHRGQHALSERATRLFEETRQKVKNFLSAQHTEEIIFTHGTTDAINSLAQSLKFEKGDEILVSELEHHSNFIPWQKLAEKKSLKLKVIPISKKGDVIFEEFEKLITRRTKLLALNYVSNALGTVVPVERYIKVARKHGTKVLIDAAQAVATRPISVQKLDCDFLVFSSHKMFGPFGVGVLYGKRQELESLEPFRYGGGAVDRVEKENTTLLELPFRLEPGTPPVAEVIALSSALDYIQTLGWQRVQEHEATLTEKALEVLSDVKGLCWVGEPHQRTSILSFYIKGVHPLDVVETLNEQGFLLRSGHHCAQPLFESLGLEGSVRISLSIYNTVEEILSFKKALENSLEVLK